MNYVIKNASKGKVLIIFEKNGNKYIVYETVLKHGIVRKEVFDKYDIADTWFNARCVANGITEIEDVEHDPSEFANID